MSTRGRVVVVYDENNIHSLDGKLTAPVVIICIAVSFCGLMYGYDTGAAVNVSKTEPFVKKFFPAIAKRLRSPVRDEFCVFNTMPMLLYLSALFVAAVFSSFIGGYLTTSSGRKGALMIGSIIYTIGAAIQAAAMNVQILTLGRVIIGFGLGLTTQSSPIYMTEMAPTKWRGAFGTCFQLFFSTGMLAGFVVVNVTSKYGDIGWRIALGLCAVPGTIVTIAAILMPDTPSSLIQRGKLQEALQSLSQLRSKEADVQNELKFLVKYNEAIRRASEKPYEILLERKYRPQLVLAIALSAFQHITGNNATTNYNLIFLRSLGLSPHQMLVRTFMINVATTFSVFVAIYFVDRVGRRMLFLQGSIQMIICHLGLAFLMASQIQGKGSAILGNFLIIGTTLGFTWSWGPLPWLVPAEIFPIEIRPAGHGIAVAVNLGFRFIVAQITMPLLCQFRYGMYFFYAVLIIFMLTFVLLFVPETKRIPLESMDRIWHTHWYWHRFVGGSPPKL